MNPTHGFIALALIALLWALKPVLMGFIGGWRLEDYRRGYVAGWKACAKQVEEGWREVLDEHQQSEKARKAQWN